MNESELRKRASRKSPHPGGYHNKAAQPRVPVHAISSLPDHPCPNCGARGLCGHNGRVPT